MKEYNNELNKIEHSLQSLELKRNEISDNMNDLKHNLSSISKNTNNFNQALFECNRLALKKHEIIDKKLNSKWQEFSQIWEDWEYIGIIHWFKYILNENISMSDNEIEIDWKLIQDSLKTRELHGNYLLICNEAELRRLGFKSEIDRKHLLRAIKNLTTTKPLSMRNETDEKEKEKEKEKAQDKEKTSTKEKENIECCICLENKINTVFIPCGHACMCKPCSQKYQRDDGCPMCRKSIQSIFDLFF